ncbi:hypothetical protein P7C70_g7052, partial [Phenoliferia sp. Uapishka_3]
MLASAGIEIEPAPASIEAAPILATPPPPPSQSLLPPLPEEDAKPFTSQDEPIVKPENESQDFTPVQIGAATWIKKLSRSLSGKRYRPRRRDTNAVVAGALPLPTSVETTNPRQSLDRAPTGEPNDTIKEALPLLDRKVRRWVLRRFSIKPTRELLSTWTVLFHIHQLLNSQPSTMRLHTS